MVNHVLAGTRFFPAKRNLLRSIGYEIGENTKIVGPIHNTGDAPHWRELLDRMQPHRPWKWSSDDWR